MLKTTDVSALLPTQLVIGDQLIGSASGGEFDHVNPATGRIQRTIPMAGPSEIDRAVVAARSALEEWRRWTPPARRRVLLKLADLIRDHAEDLATVVTLEAGLTRALHAPWLVEGGAERIEDAAGWADKIYGETLPTGDKLFNYTSPEAFGVIGIITTWNGSVASFAMAAGPALAAGCTVVVKPSELAPFGPLRCAALALEAGIPAGVVNVVPGTADSGAALVSHPGIDKICFTGSPPTARKIAMACAQTLKPCVLELGGKSARIVFDDADLSVAVATTANVAVCAGQQCTLGSRLLVQRRVYEQFADDLVKALKSIKVGDPFDTGTMMGPVINSAACERILGLVDRARSYGTVRFGGERLSGTLADGYFLSPALIEGVDNQSEIARTEVFGPVFAMIPFDDEDEAVAIANDSEYGLAAYVTTQSVSRALRVAARLDAENIGVNGGWAPGGYALPFGGRKSSGYGKLQGLAGVREFLHSKTVQITLD